MPATFSWFLALRYLMTRWVNLLGMCGVAVAVWALIVVIAVMSGFIEEMTDNIHNASPDLLVTKLRPGCTESEVRPLVAADPDVVSVAPRITQYAMVFPHGIQVLKPTHNLQTRPTTQGYVQLVGIDLAAESRTTGVRDWLMNAPTAVTPEWAPAWRYDTSDLENPFKLSAAALRKRLAWSPRLPRLPRDQLQVRDLDAIVLGIPQCYSEKLLLPGQQLELVSARFEKVADKQELLKIKKPVRLAGAFQSRSPFLDDLVGLVDIDMLREMLGRDPFFDGDDFYLITDLAIKVRAGADLNAVKARLQGKLPADVGGTVQTWRDQNRKILDAVALERGMMKVVLFVVMLVAAFLIYATLNMMVTQKTKDIGILTSMGATPGGVAAIFLLGGTIVGLVGNLLGVLTGILSAVYLNDFNAVLKAWFGVEIFAEELFYLPSIPYRLEPVWIGQVVIATFFLSLLVSFLPAHKAGRLPPVEALSYE
ncbi:MAG: FtsX-like permease family protein [Planctomycetota bacterium]